MRFVLCLPNARTDCAPYGRPLKVIVQCKHKDKRFGDLNVSLDEKLKMVPFYIIFYCTLNEAIS